MRLMVWIVSAWLSVSVAWAAPWHKPPAAPIQGYGSAASYLTDQVSERTLGSPTDGSLVWVYEPAVLKNGASAPVVVFLHGFAALRPAAYISHIRHIARQGIVVIYPQFQISQGPGVLAESGLRGEVDQNRWAQRAVDATEAALASLGTRADRSQLYLYGHSLGGLIASAWEYSGGPRPVHYTLAHPAFDSSAGMPAFVQSLVKIKPIDWRQVSGSITAPVTILHGEDDRIAPVSQSEALVAALRESAIPHILYKARRDRYGAPNLSPNHGAPLDRISPIPQNFKVFGISFELNALDYRYYFAGLDAVMNGQGLAIPFDFGKWSSGRPVVPPLAVTRYPD